MRAISATLGVVRGRAVTARRAATLILGVAAALACWAAYLAATLAATDHRSHWVALDVIEVLALCLIARALARGRLRTAAAACLVGVPLLWYDALMDVTSSHHLGPALGLAIAMAVLVELPASAALLRLAWGCLRPRPAA